MKIEVLYPEVCNLYGELSNAEYLARCSGAEIIGTPLGMEPAFVSQEIALVSIGATTERGQVLARDALAPSHESLERRTEAGGVTLATGNALELFGEYIDCDGGERLPMLGLFPIYSERRLHNRHNSFYLGKLDDMEVVGFKSQFGHSYGDNGEGLFQTVRGVGLNPEVQAEGLRRKNFMATYLIGPLLILNPPFTKYLQSIMGISEPTIPFEAAAMDVYNTHRREFSDPSRKAVY